MEERIIEYKNNSEIEPIIIKLTKENFLLVKHAIRNKTLYFKKITSPPETHSIILM